MFSLITRNFLFIIKRHLFKLSVQILIKKKITILFFGCLELDPFQHMKKVVCLHFRSLKIRQYCNKSPPTRTYLAIIHFGLHDTFHVLLLHGWWHPKTVAHTENLRPALRIRHFHRTVKDDWPRVQLKSKTTTTRFRREKCHPHFTKTIFHQINTTGIE